MSVIRNLLFSGLLACQSALLAQGATGLSVEFQPDGSAKLENDLVALRVANRPGQANGILAWQFKPTGIEMVDVALRPDRLREGPSARRTVGWGRVQGLRRRRARGRHALRAGNQRRRVRRFGPRSTQVSRGGYALARTLVLRRDWAGIEARYRLDNVNGKTVGASLRFHGALSPGARGKYQRKDEHAFPRAEQTS